MKEVRDQARAHDLVNENDVATALDLTIMYKPDFYNADWARDVFAIAIWPGFEKMQVIRRRIRTQLKDF